MVLEQLYTKCLAQGAYFISHNGEAAVIDPLREVAPYLELASVNDVKIKYIFLTHFHADFVSGQNDLAAASGATIVFGPEAQPAYKYYQARDGETFTIGGLKLKAIHTPGHTLESTCYLLTDENNVDQAIFTGDTLFIGDVGRPDLAAKSTMTVTDMAGLLYDSLHTKLSVLNPNIVVYPAHGAGSACGKNMSSETSDSLGNQIATNYAFKLAKDDFVKELTNGLATPPGYFPQNVAMNKMVNNAFEAIIKNGTQKLTADEFSVLAGEDDVVVLDTRSNSDFVNGSIPNAIFVGLHGQFAPWVGAVLSDVSQKIIFIAESGKEEEVVTRLSRVGFDNCLGYLEGGLKAWEEAHYEVVKTDEITAQGFIDGLVNQSVLNPVDVRKPGEFAASHIQGIKHLPLDNSHQNINTLEAEKTYHVHCAGGYRSLIYISLARRQGVSKVINVLGGYNAIKKADLKSITLT